MTTESSTTAESNAAKPPEADAIAASGDPGTLSEPIQGTIGRNSLRVLISQASGNAGYFVAVLVLARALGPADRGSVAFITVTTLVASQLATLGVSDATTVLAARSPELRAVLLTNLTTMAAAVGAIAGLCVATLLTVVPGLRPAGVHSVELVILVLGTVAASWNNAGYAFLQGCGRFAPYARVQASIPWLYAATLVIVNFTVGLTIARAVAIWSALMALGGLRLLWASGSVSGWGRLDMKTLWESIRFGVRAWVGSSSRLLNARTDQIITGVIATTATLGIYAVAVNASEILYYLASAAATALIPAVAAGDPGTRVARTLRVHRTVLLLTLVAVLVGAGLGPLLLPLVFGSAYRPSVGPFLILIPSALGFATMSVFSGAALGSLAPGRSSLGPVAALIVQTALDFSLIPIAGASGASAAATAALLVGGGVAILSYRARFPFPWRLLVPRPGDVRTLGRLARGILRPTSVASS